MTDQELITLVQQTRDARAFEQVKRRHVNLVESLARRFIGSGEPFEDLAQEGWIGFFTAVDRFNPKKTAKFHTYATHFVVGQIRHYLRDKGRSIKVPRWVQELNQQFTKRQEALEQKLGRSASLEDMLEESPDDTEAIIRGWELVSSSARISSVEEMVGADYGIGDSEWREIYPCENDPAITRLEKYDDLLQALDQLSNLQREVIELVYYEELTFPEAAKRMGISESYAFQVRHEAAEQLRFLLESEEAKY
jgi:RNA polymerase sigma-B factor